MPDAALVEAIRALLAASPFHGEGYRKIWARLRFAGVRTSRRRVLRLTREHGLQAPGRVGRPHDPRAHDMTAPSAPSGSTRCGHRSDLDPDRRRAGLDLRHRRPRFERVPGHPRRKAGDALRGARAAPPGQAVRFAFGTFGQGSAGGLKLRHDHGSQFVADDFQRELAFLGIASSPAFVREPEGNGCVERFIRTLKENLLWVRRFATIDELRQALHRFKDTYNHTWIVERHGYQTPAAVRAAQLAPLPVAA
jgi:putative transposase